MQRPRRMSSFLAAGVARQARTMATATAARINHAGENEVAFSICVCQISIADASSRPILTWRIHMKKAIFSLVAFSFIFGRLSRNQL